MRLRQGLLVFAAVLVWCAPAGAQAPDPAYLPSQVKQTLEYQTRGRDQLAHPGFQQRSAPLYPRMPVENALVWVDPYRDGWACTTPGVPAGCRGEALEVRIPNRYGARMHARIYSKTEPDGPLPGVILLTGGGDAEVTLREVSHGLAEAGYLVLAVAVQGDWYADAQPPDPVASTAENEYCRPYNYGNWQAPQEMGITEEQQCAGSPEAGDPDPRAPVSRVADFVGHWIVQDDPPGIAESYHRVRARKVFGALDAASWFLSEANPRRSLLDPTRLGIAGHSLGAHGALLAGNGDPQDRFDVVVSFDGFGELKPTTSARVPTLFLHQELQTGYGAPRRARPDYEGLMPGYADAAKFRAGGVPTMLVVPDAATHSDFAFVNYPPIWVGATVLGLCPICITGLNGTRDGSRIALHYTQAWFDRFLKPGQEADARRRLLAQTYPESADASSIGQGTWSPMTGENEPYEIGGESARDRLSAEARSFAYFDGVECPDLRAGC